MLRARPTTASCLISLAVVAAFLVSLPADARPSWEDAAAPGDGAFGARASDRSAAARERIEEGAARREGGDVAAAHHAFGEALDLAPRDSETLRELVAAATGIVPVKGVGDEELAALRLGLERAEDGRLDLLVQVGEDAACAVPPVSRRPMTMNLGGVDFGDLLTWFAHAGRTEIVAEGRVAVWHPVTLDLDEVPWDVAFRNLVGSQGLSCFHDGEKIVVR